MAGVKVNYQIYKELLSCFQELVAERLGSSLLSLVLYGSVARGEGGAESDIDLLLILETAPQVYYERIQPIVEIQYQLRRTQIYKALTEKRLTPCLSCLVLGRQEAEENRHIFLDMLEDSIILFDKGNFFARRLGELKERLSLLGAQKIILPNGSWYWDLKPDLVAGEVFEL